MAHPNNEVDSEFADRITDLEEIQTELSKVKWQQEEDKNTFSKEYMLEFAWFLVDNIGQFSCDRTAHFQGKYLEKFKKK